MVTSAVNMGIDYGAYSGMQLSALLDDIQTQRENLDNKERQIRKAISSLDVKSKSKNKEEKAFYSPENVAVLKQGYKELKAGRGIERELIDA